MNQSLFAGLAKNNMQSGKTDINIGVEENDDLRNADQSNFKTGQPESLKTIKKPNFHEKNK